MLHEEVEMIQIEQQINNNKKEMIVPVISLCEFVMFPNIVLHFDISKKSSIDAIEEALNSNKKILLVTQKDPKNEDDLNSLGVLSSIKQIIKQNDDFIRILVEGEVRAQAEEFLEENGILKAKIFKLHQKKIKKDTFDEALLINAKELFLQYLKVNAKPASDLMIDPLNFEDIGKSSDYIISNIPLKSEVKQSLLEEINPITRLQKVIVILSREIEIMKYKNDISNKVKDNLDKSQKDYIVREQIKLLSQELDGDSDPISEYEAYKKKLESLSLEKETHDKILKECKSLSKTHSNSPDANIQRNYLDFCLSLPWNKSTEEKLDISKAREILDSKHYGLEDVKKRIIEFLAVKQLSPNKKGQIICLSGPPGVGKTSIAKSLAKALNRKFVRISLGGTSDESEIRGHRKTYLGAMPGRIISSIGKVNVNNPLILLDEIDKLSKDYKGDPASALLEVLDPEQNNQFHDRYLDIPFDLSKVMFIVTANDKSLIPRPLYDRMEIIDLYSYTYDEKFKIAKKHLISKQLEENGLDNEKFAISDDALKKLIKCYTREAGVRELERKIASLMRKTAYMIVSGEVESIKIDEKKITEFLGPEKFKIENKDKENKIGVVNGLAWTSVGGETMPIEVVLMEGKGKLLLTGSLGNVMKESAQIALSYIRSNCKELGISSDFYKRYDIHIHASEGAVPKDGPSAGVTMTTALVSALCKKAIYADVAMTGEITLKGKVLAIGGLKEKSMAAYKEGIKTVIIPYENESDLQKVDDVVKNSVKFITAKDLKTVFKYSIENFSEMSSAKK